MESSILNSEDLDNIVSSLCPYDDLTDVIIQFPFFDGSLDSNGVTNFDYS